MPLARAQDCRRGVCLAFVLAVAGCAGLDDPFQRAGTWQLEHVNDANLAAMVVDQHHLTQGVGDESSPGVLSAAAIRRLLTDRVKPLASTGVGPIGSNAAPPGGGSDSGGAGGL